MRVWRMVAIFALPLASAAADAQVLAHDNIHSPTNFSLPKTSNFTASSPFRDGMIAQEEVAPNARIGLGLAPMLGRNIHSVMIENELVPTRNPGVNLVFRFHR